MNDFISPSVVLHELLPGNRGWLRFILKWKFPGLNFHTNLTDPSPFGSSLSDFPYQEIFYPRSPGEKNEVWVFDKRTMRVEIKRSTSASDWSCCNGGNFLVQRIQLESYEYERGQRGTI
jgi:hypothetical protein